MRNSDGKARRRASYHTVDSGWSSEAVINLLLPPLWLLISCNCHVWNFVTVNESQSIQKGEVTARCYLLRDASHDRNCAPELEQCLFSHLLFAFRWPWGELWQPTTQRWSCPDYYYFTSCEFCVPLASCLSAIDNSERLHPFLTFFAA